MAQKADVVIYAISTNITRGETDGDKILKYLASETGGQAFFPFKVEDLEQSFENIANELRHQYNIFYRPEPLKTDGLYHTVAVRVKGRKDLVVRAARAITRPRCSVGRPTGLRNSARPAGRLACCPSGPIMIPPLPAAATRQAPARRGCWQRQRAAPKYTLTGQKKIETPACRPGPPRRASPHPLQKSCPKWRSTQPPPGVEGVVEHHHTVTGQLGVDDKPVSREV